MLLPGLGTYTGYLSASDTDWYAAKPTGLLCVETSVTPEIGVNVALPLDGDASARELATRASAGTTTTFGSTLTDLRKVSLGLSPVAAGQQGGYQFSLKTVSIPSLSAGDALSGTDAGNTLATALATTSPCIGGHLTTLSGAQDLADHYRLQGTAGQVLTLSFAAAGGAASPLRLSVLDSAGSVIGTVIASGQAASVTLPSTGTYYVSTSSETPVEDEGYLFGMMLGPPESGCRPQC